MQPSNDEKALIARAQRGDKMAISTLYSTHLQPIYRYVRYRVDSDALAEDITAEVFLRMVRELARYQYTGAPFRAWLYRVAYNCIIDLHHRASSNKPEEELLDDLPAEAPDPFQVLVLAEDHAQLQLALNSLSSDYQNILILRFINDVSHAEVAAIMGKSEAATRVLQHRALKALATALHAIQQGGLR